jgi:hypothetical protein
MLLQGLRHQIQAQQHQLHESRKPLEQQVELANSQVSVERANQSAL